MSAGVLEGVEGWGPGSVSSWLCGLGLEVGPAASAAASWGLGGRSLLLLTHGDLIAVGVPQFGIRQVILSAVSLLNHLCHNLEEENAASLALCVVVAAKGLRAAVELDNPAPILAAISTTVDEAKKLISWLDRRPFAGKTEYVEIRNTIMSLVMAMVKETQRTTGKLKLPKLHNLALRLIDICNKVVSGINDPMLLTTAYMERVVIRKSSSNQDMGMTISTSYRGVHVVSAVAEDSPAAASGKVEPGDELCRVNDQLVVGWDKDALTDLLRRPSRETLLLVKRRPRESAGRRSQPSTPRLPNRLHPQVQPPPPPQKPPPTHFPMDSTSTRRKVGRLRSSSTMEMSSEETSRRGSRKPSRADEGAEEAALSSDVFLSKLEAILKESEGLDEPPEPERAPSVIRRASISGGSPTLVRVSRHLSRKSSLHPSQPSNWLHPPPILKQPTLRSVSPTSSTSSSEEGAVFLPRVESSVVELISGEELARLQALLMTDRAGGSEEWSMPVPLSAKASVATAAVVEEADEWDVDEYFDLGPPAHLHDSSHSDGDNANSLVVSSKKQRLVKQDSTDSFRSLPDKSRLKLAKFFGTAPPNDAATENKYGTLPARSKPRMSESPSAVELMGVRKMGSLYQCGLGAPSSDAALSSSLPGTARAVEGAGSLWEAGELAAEELEPSEMRSWLWRGRLPVESQSGSKWRKRWVVLKGPLLFVFKSPASMEAEGVISLRNFEAKIAGEASYHGSKKYVMNLCSTTSKVWYLFNCESGQNRAVWLKQIGAARIELSRQLKPAFEKLHAGGAYWREFSDEPQTPLGRLRGSFKKSSASSS